MSLADARGTLQNRPLALHSHIIASGIPPPSQWGVRTMFRIRVRICGRCIPTSTNPRRAPRQPLHPPPLTQARPARIRSIQTGLLVFLRLDPRWIAEPLQLSACCVGKITLFQYQARECCVRRDFPARPSLLTMAIGGEGPDGAGSTSEGTTEQQRGTRERARLPARPGRRS